MEQFQLLITEVTRFGDLFCVAGWDLDRKRMIRPRSLQSPGFWNSNFCGQNHVFQKGNIVSFSGSRDTSAKFPHAVENYYVTSQWITPQQQLSESEIIRELKLHGGFSNSLASAFNGFLARESKSYIQVGTKVNSLAGLIVESATFAFDDKSGKLRGYFWENNICYCPTVTSDSIKTLWERNGVGFLNHLKQNSNFLYLRLGLTQEWNGGKCYLQINEIYFIK